MFLALFIYLMVLLGIYVGDLQKMYQMQLKKNKIAIII